MVKDGATVLYPIHAVILNLSIGLQQKPILSANVIVKLLLLENCEIISAVDLYKKLGSREMEGIVLRLQLVSAEDSTEPKTRQRGHDEERETEHTVRDKLWIAIQMSRQVDTRECFR